MPPWLSLLPWAPWLTLAASSTPELAPSVAAGLVPSITFGGLAWWVIQRLWRERDEDRRDQRGLIEALVLSTEAIKQNTEVMKVTQDLLR